ncbi:unnamed protein product [Brassica napus]|uniref:(rape) hypothetical protein n=1 Tax=Brassica napus TaxID=3708 RepID=A0A816J219_BRANA|nr:unnamed protein product [Brassica napus]
MLKGKNGGDSCQAFGFTKAETNRVEEVDCRSPLCCSKPLYVQRSYKACAHNHAKQVIETCPISFLNLIKLQEIVLLPVNKILSFYKSEPCRRRKS